MPILNSHEPATFNGGTITLPLTIANPASNTDSLTITSNGGINQALIRATAPHSTIICDGDGQFQFASDDGAQFSVAATAGTEASLQVSGNGGSFALTSDSGITNTAAAGVPVAKGFRSRVITSGALPTQSFSSGVGAQLLTTRDVTVVIPFTGDGTNNAATLKIELSPDNVTYSTLDTLSIAAALNFTGALNVPLTLAVPAGWYVKLTATHGAIGTATYY